MTLALDLGSRGVPVIVIENSHRTTSNPRCNTTNSRTMEYFRRFGIANRIRRAGLPLTHTTDMVYMTSMSGYELTRFEFSSARQVLDGTAPEAAEWPTPELQHRISQIYLEPILDQELARYSSVRVLRGVAFESLEQIGDSVHVRARRDSGALLSFSAEWVTGCDGGASLVRKSVGASLGGDAHVGEKRLSVYFRSNEVPVPGERQGWRYLWRGQRYHGAILQLDGSSLFLCHARVPENEPLEMADPDVAMREAIGYDIAHEKLDVVRWIPRRLVADRFRIGRVVLAGDAAHVWLPDGGFGMNTGIADAMALGWRLAAIHEGWGSDALVDDYAFERRSIGEATSAAAKTIGTEMVEMSRVLANPVLSHESVEGEHVRHQAAALIQAVDRKQWYSKGVQFGQDYAGSPGIPSDEGDSLEGLGIARIDEYTPSVRAGTRLPHRWLDERTLCVFDLVGQGWTLLCVGVDVPAAVMLDTVDVPLTVAALPAEAADTYERRYVLVRPDMHVAWSGDELPADMPGRLRRLCGFGRQDQRAAAEDILGSKSVQGIDDPFEGTSWSAAPPASPAKIATP